VMGDLRTLRAAPSPRPRESHRVQPGARLLR
jgi:hypothetical protein